MPRSAEGREAREARKDMMPCDHGVRGCVGDAIGTPDAGAGPICVRHAVQYCGKSPVPEEAELDRQWKDDGYEVLRHPAEQPAPEEGPLEPWLRTLMTFSAMQLQGNGHGQPAKDKTRTKNYAQVWTVYAFAAVVAYIKKTNNKPTKKEQIKPYIDAAWRRLARAAAVGVAAGALRKRRRGGRG